LYIVKTSPRSRRFLCRKYTVVLAFLWIAGLLCGAFFAGSAEDPYFALMRMGVFSRVSIVGLFVLIFFPLLLSALAVYFRLPAAIYLIAFAKAILFGYTMCATSIAFASAGWLIRFLYTFCDAVFILFLLWFWIRRITFGRANLRKDVLICTAAGILISLIDYFCISPFLVMLMCY